MALKTKQHCLIESLWVEALELRKYSGMTWDRFSTVTLTGYSASLANTQTEENTLAPTCELSLAPSDKDARRHQPSKYLNQETMHLFTGKSWFNIDR